MTPEERAKMNAESDARIAAKAKLGVGPTTGAQKAVNNMVKTGMQNKPVSAKKKTKKVSPKVKGAGDLLRGRAAQIDNAVDKATR